VSEQRAHAAAMIVNAGWQEMSLLRYSEAMRSSDLALAAASPLQLPPAWQMLEERFNDPRLDRLPAAQLESLAIRFTLGRLLHEAIETAERGWRLLSQDLNQGRLRPRPLQARMG
jgi:hypothetical protein